MAKVVLKNVRLGPYPRLWVPENYQNVGDKKWSAKFLFAPTHPATKDIEKTIKQVATETWKEKADSVLASIKGIPTKFCFHNGNTKPDLDGFPGNLFISASTNSARDKAPEIRDRDKSLLPQGPRPYGGCYVNAILDIWPQDNQFGRGIQAKLLGVQFVSDGDAFIQGATATEDDYEDLPDGDDAPDLGSAEGGAGGFV